MEAMDDGWVVNGDGLLAICGEKDGRASADASDSAMFASFLEFDEPDHIMELAPSTSCDAAALTEKGPVPSLHHIASDLDLTAFLSPPHSSYSPNPMVDNRSSPFLLPPSPAEQSLESFCSAGDLVTADVDVGLMMPGFSNPMPWMDLSPPSITEALPPPTDDLIKLLRSETANACQQLLSEPVKRKPGRKKKGELSGPSPSQKLPTPPLTHVKSESDSDHAVAPTITAGLPLTTTSTTTPSPLTKRQERMVKNREAADQSRKRKREHLASLETHAQALITENDELRARVLELEGINFRLEKENVALRSLVAEGDSKVKVGLTGLGQGSSLTVQIGSLVKEGEGKKVKRDGFFGSGNEMGQGKTLGAVFMVFFFSLFLFVLPGTTPPSTLTSTLTHPSISSWSSKVLTKLTSNRAAIPRIDAAPAPLLLPGNIMTSQLLTSTPSTSFILTSPKLTHTPPISDTIQHSITIPLANLSDILTALSVESGISEDARDRVIWLRDLLVTQGDGDRETEEGGLLRRVGPNLVSVGKDLIPLSFGDDTPLPVVVEDYLASLRDQKPLSIPSKDSASLIYASPNSAMDVTDSSSSPTRLFPSRFCPPLREKLGPLLSLVANLPVRDDLLKPTVVGGRDEVLDPLSWSHGRLEREFGRWMKEEGEGVRGGMGGSFLQLDVEVVGARIVNWNETL
ncbi:hypothetical protein HDU67_001404 [Dinochytrium kinnereticum]|nr:hypothetical protein HDU67_001404 [Dinochytrium kinnereticum]